MMSSKADFGHLPKLLIRRLVIFSLLFSCVVGTLQWLRLPPMLQVDSFFYDAFIRLGGESVKPSPAVLVNIDDNSLSEVGQWPWPRYKLSQLLSAIQEGNPKAVALDVIFPEPDRTALTNLSYSYRKEFGLDLPLENIPEELRDNDVFLGALMAEYGSVGAVFFLFDQTNRSAVQMEPPKPLQIGGEVDQLRLEQASGSLQNTFKIQSQIKYSGFINSKPDYDGKVRRLPLLLGYGGKVYPHLLLATLMRAEAIQSISISHDLFGPLLQVGQHSIPIHPDGTLMLRYRTPVRDFQILSALDILRSGMPQGVAEGRMVIVGSSAAALNDLINTPVDNQFPGLGVYAEGLGNILAGEQIREPEWQGESVLIQSLLCGGLIALMFVMLSGSGVLLAGLSVILAVLVGVSAWLFVRFGLYLSPAAGVVASLGSFAGLSLAYYTSEKQRAIESLELVSNTQRVAIESMAAVAETRDPETGGHIKRTQSYVKALGEELAREGKHPDILTKEYIEWLYLSAPLHDIGKVGIHDSILLKPGKLDDDEFHQMKQHARFGQEIIQATSKSIKGDNFLRVAGEIASCHHEKWNGTGYPAGLAGEAIPLSARLMAVADVYDALVSKRCYKPAFSHQDARDYLLKKSGEDFDPDVIAAFVAIENTIIAISENYKDDGAFEEA